MRPTTHPPSSAAAAAKALATVCVVEAVCTAVFVTLWAALVGTKPTLAGSALAGLAFAVCSAAAISTSGGHLSPSITAGLALSRHAAAGPAAAYVLSQVAGGLLAALLTALTFSPRPALAGHGGADGPLCLPPLGGTGPGWAAAAWEAGGTAVVVFTAFAHGVLQSGRGDARPHSNPLTAPAALGAAVAVVTAAASAAGGKAGRVVHLNPALSLASLVFACEAGLGKAVAVHLAAQAAGAAVGAASACGALGAGADKEAAEVGGGEQEAAPLLGGAAGGRASPAPGLPVTGEV